MFIAQQSVFFYQTQWLVLIYHALALVVEFFYFYIIFFDLSKIYINFFLQNCHHVASSFGGKEIPPDEPAVGAVGPRLTAYRRLNWR